MPLYETARSLRQGTRDAALLLTKIEARMEAREPVVRAMLPESGRFERLVREVEGLLRRFPDPAARPPLFGVPVAVKDIIHVDGFPTRAGSALPPEELTEEEGPVVRALRAAGGLVLGKAHTTEFAYFNPAPTRNPRDPAHTPGGSSSGSAAAVAAGYCPLAIGTQTVGSVIRPASYCGVVGFKPSQGRVPTEGIIPFSKNVDQVGFFTTDVAGAALAGSIFCAGWRSAGRRKEPGVLGVPEGPLLERVEPEALRVFRAGLVGLRARGWRIAAVPVLDDLERVRQAHEALTAWDMAQAHQAWHPRFADRYGETTRRLIEAGRAVPPDRVRAGRASMATLRAKLDGVLRDQGYDAFLCPGTTGPAPLGLESTGDPILNLPWTHAGLPVACIPSGSLGGLPLSFQVAGRFGDDEALLEVCSLLFCSENP